MAPENLLPYAPWLLAASVWALALAISQRHFWAAVGLEAFDAGWSAGPESITPTGEDELYDSFYEQLLALGFTPAGTTWEQVRGRVRIESRAFLHPTEAWRASTWRALGGDYRVYFVTQFAKGAVLTANYSRPIWQEPNYLARGLPTLDLAQLLEEHRHDVALQVARGNEPERCDSLDEIVRAKRAYHQIPAVSGKYRRTEWFNFNRRLLYVGFLPTCVALVMMLRREPAAATYAWLVALAFSVGMVIFLRLVRAEILTHMTAQQRAADGHRDSARI